MSLYSEYIQEHHGDGIIETEEGFASYRFIGPHQCYIVDIYIRPKFRKTLLATEIADRITTIAKARGCTELLGSVHPAASGSTASLKVLLSYGMSLKSCEQNLIIFNKDI